MDTITVRGKSMHSFRNDFGNLEKTSYCIETPLNSSVTVNGFRSSDTLILIDGIKLDDTPSADGSFNLGLLNNKLLKHKECINDTTLNIENNDSPQKDEITISHSIASRNTVENSAKVSHISDGMLFYTCWNILSSDGYRVMDCTSNNFDSRKKIASDTQIEINPNDSLNVILSSRAGFLKNTYPDLFNNYEKGELSSKFLLNKAKLKKICSLNTNFSLGYANIIQSISDYSSSFSSNKSISNLFMGSLEHQFNENYLNEFSFQLKKTRFNSFESNSYIFGVKNYLQLQDNVKFRIIFDFFISKNVYFLDMYTTLKRSLEKSELSISYDRFNKRPSLFQLYDTKFGNRDIKPEKIESVRISYSNHKKGVCFSQSISYKIVKNLIALDKASYCSKNSGNNKKIVAINTFLSLIMKPLNSTFEIKYTYVANPFIQYPKHKLLISLFVYDIFKIENKTIACVKDYDFINGKNVTLGGATIFTIKLFKKISTNSDLQIYVKNIFNKKYQLTYGYNQEPISFGIEIKYKL